MSFTSQLKRKFSPSLVAQLGYSEKDILVIVNIDDVGLHKDETEASFKALKFGIVKSGSIMVPGANFDHVMELWKENPDLDLGIHLTLTCEWGNKFPWAPVLPQADVPSLYNPEGIMWPTLDSLVLHAEQGDIQRELEAQVNKVFDAGLKPTHMDYHMNFAFDWDLFPVVTELSRKFGLPMRAPKRKIFKLPFVRNNLWSLRRKGYVFPDTRKGIYMMGGDDQSLEFRKARYHDHLRSLNPGVHNIHIHIAYQTQELQDLMGLHDASIRQIDYDVWTSDDTKKLAEELGITFIGYRPLQRLQERFMCTRSAQF
jgi:predicted glycoside hydrolase/deacetylase ChbG (UPF0249 family)